MFDGFTRNLSPRASRYHWLMFTRWKRKRAASELRRYLNRTRFASADAFKENVDAYTSGGYWTHGRHGDPASWARSKMAQDPLYQDALYQKTAHLHARWRLPRNAQITL